MIKSISNRTNSEEEDVKLVSELSDEEIQDQDGSGGLEIKFIGLFGCMEHVLTPVINNIKAMKLTLESHNKCMTWCSKDNSGVRIAIE